MVRQRSRQEVPARRVGREASRRTPRAPRACRAPGRPRTTRSATSSLAPSLPCSALNLAVSSGHTLGQRVKMKFATQSVPQQLAIGHRAALLIGQRERRHLAQARPSSVRSRGAPADDAAKAATRGDGDSSPEQPANPSHRHRSAHMANRSAARQTSASSASAANSSGR